MKAPSATQLVTALGRQTREHPGEPLTEQLDRLAWEQRDDDDHWPECFLAMLAAAEHIADLKRRLDAVAEERDRLAVLRGPA